MAYEKLSNSNHKKLAWLTQKTRRSICAMSFAPSPSQPRQILETQEGNVAVPTEAETSQCLSRAQEVLFSMAADGACAESISQELKEMHQEICSIMNSALYRECPSVEKMQQASRAILLAQNYNGFLQQEEWSPRNWLTTFTQLVEQAVVKKIPKPPLERLGPTDPENVLLEYLQLISGTVLETLRKLSPGLGDTLLLDCVVDCCHRQFFSQLDQVLNCALTADKIYLLLYWVVHEYLSDQFFGHPDIMGNSFKAVDMMVLSDWLQRSEKALLSAVQDDVSKRLCLILQNDHIYWNNCILGNEEDFIKLHIDVIQVLQGRIVPAGEISKRMQVRVQEVCCQELMVFLEKFLERERKHLKKHNRSGTIYPFRTFSTSMELREYLQTIAQNRNDDTIKAVHSLKSIEAESLELVLRRPFSVIEPKLREYFKKGKELKMSGFEEIRMHFTSLPKTNQEAHKIVVDAAYDRLASLYQKYLLQSKKRELENTWVNVGDKVIADAENFHLMFSRANPAVAKRNQLLLNVGMILNCNDVEALKITVTHLRGDYAYMSQELVRSVLRWKGLSQTQVNKVLEAGEECLFSADPLNNKQRGNRDNHCCCCLF